jgi:SAM-dependent methyltransferase
MAQPDWPDIARTYDTVAAEYAKTFADELDHKPFDRELLDRFAETMANDGPVWDIGCGPAGHVARYLADRGVRVVGADLSPGAVASARTREPDLEFRVADMLALPTETGSVHGIVAFYSAIHLPRQRIPEAFAEFRRVLVDGGPLLVAMHGGEGEVGQDEWFGHPVETRATLVSLAELVQLLEGAGFGILERHARPPYESEYPSERLYVWARA